MEKNYGAGRRSLERAIELSPFNATARLRYSWVLLRARQLDEAVREMRLAQEYDPLSAVNNAALCGMLVFERNYDEAISSCDRASEINPATPTLAHSRANAYFFKGDKKKAILELEAFTKDDPEHFPEIGTLGYFYAKAGNKDMALRTIETLDKAAKECPRLNNDMAVISYALGRKAAAFEFLERSIDTGWLTNLTLFDPTFDEIKADPLFDELIRRKNFKDAPDKP